MEQQDAFFRRMIEHPEADPGWENVEMDVVVQDIDLATASFGAILYQRV
jgi:hypothetical protein